MKHGKKYNASKALVENLKQYDPREGVETVLKTATAKFDETVEISLRLGVDSRHADQQVRGAVVLPNGDEETVNKIKNENWFDFDVCVATPDMMGVVGRIGRILGPKGLMPNPKSGTVTMDVTKAIHDIKAGKVEYRVDKTNIVHCPIGKVSFGADKLLENLDTLMDAVIKAKPASAKGTYIKSMVVSTTMGPGVKFNPLKF